MPQLKPALYSLSLLGTLAACEMLGPPSDLPAGAQRMRAPEAYQVWWEATESCARLRGDFESVEWYVVPGASTFDTPAGPKVGLWTRSSEGIRIVVADRYAEHELVVRHEMLHALLDREGHPREYFTRRCGLTWDRWHGDH